MHRRHFIKTTALGSVLLTLEGCLDSPKTHVVTFSFDDGFKKSFYRAAEVFDNYGLKACLNVIARGHFPDFKKIDQWILPELLGDFNDWNKLKGLGHEVMPHTWEHLNLLRVPMALAKKNIDKCLDYFEANLDGYNPEEAVYNFAFNASNKELDDHALQRVKAIRTGGDLVLKDTRYNQIPKTTKPVRLGCWASGPGLCDDYVEQEVNDFLDSEGGWLIINLHGFDKEGWGPIGTQYMDGLLKRLLDVTYLDILPTGQVLAKYA